MRIGIMLRHLTDTMGGVVGYSHNLIKGFLRQGPEHHYALFYASDKMLGGYADRDNVSEVVLPPKHKLIWDQRLAPRAADELGLDVIFNPKLSVPLWARQHRVFVLRPEQFVHPELFPWWDRRYFKFFIPRYCRASDFVITPAQHSTEDIRHFVGVDPAKLVTVHEACGDHFFAPPPSAEELDQVRQKYSLPPEYVLFVGGLTPLKNFERLIQAYGRALEQHDVPLVVVGFGRWRFEKDMSFAQSHPAARRIHFPGFVADEDLPAVYRMATALFFPSIYEGFGIPICEAMACGCPVVTSTQGACPEVAGDAGMLVNPFEVDDMARGLIQVLASEDLRRDMIARGLARAPYFSFDRCARQTLEVFARAMDASA